MKLGSNNNFRKDGSLASTLTGAPPAPANPWIAQEQWKSHVYDSMRAGNKDYQNAMASGNYDGPVPIDPVTGRPLTPKWQSMLDDSGNLKNQYQLTDQANTQALNQYRNEALRDPSQQSTWARLMNDQINTQQMSAMDAGNQQIAAGKAGLMSDLAQTGGLGAGARERIFRNAGRDSLLNKQRTLRNANLDRSNVGIKDEENRQNMLGQAVNMDAARGSYLTNLQDKNVTNAMNEVQMGREQKQNMWTKEMENWGANKQADAQRAAACFTPDTEVAMSNGNRKKISEIEVGDETLLGGVVLQTIKTLKNWSGDIYDYAGITVTGSHAVLENGQFVRVKDSKKAKYLDVSVPIVYNLTTQNHIMIIGNSVFGDYQETNDQSAIDLDLSLRKLNEDFRPTLS